MSTQSNAMPESPALSQPVAPAAISPTRLLYWSLRRELWENRSIYIAPLAVAAIFLFGFLLSLIHLPAKLRAASALTPAQQHEIIQQPYSFVALLLMGTTLLVAIFYCLDALHGERRDRSILFWKSLPVSDLTTVLSKALIPLAILPVIVFAITICTQLIMLLISTVALLPSGLSGTTFTNLHFFQSSLVLLYGLVALALWHAPIYGWLLLVSGWARRATFLWAVLPWIAIQILEKIAFNTSHFTSLIGHRLGGFAAEAFDFQGSDHPTIDSLTQLTPGRFLSTPGLWLGLVFAAVLLAAAVRLRRYRGPI